MALGTKVNIRRISHPRYKWLATFQDGGSVRKKYFSTKTGAEDWAAKREQETLDYGTGSSLAEDERSAVLELRSRLSQVGLSVRQALDFAIGHHLQLQSSVPVSQLIEEFQREKRDSGASVRYCQDLRSRLGRFERNFGDRQVSTITSIEIEEWLRKLNLSPVSQNNFRRHLVGLFNSAKRRKYCESNPASDVPNTKTVKKPVGILTPVEAVRLLANASAPIRPVIALGLFAGVRMEELERLQWESVDLANGFVTIPAEQAKSAKRRLIPIRDNLRAWLEKSPDRSGAVWPSKGRDLLRKAKRTTGFAIPSSLTKKEKAAGITLIPWPNNALRHSFASYHLAKFKNASELALEMGHADNNMIFQHYRELVHPSEAEKYWDLVPA
ncbi:MAG: site-specific integrase [Verrucomicrobiae bacterium]|nr:site-specific integrase [Verrucomicrobiae bacterium]